jgi:single-strand DNA-binding protein
MISAAVYGRLGADPVNRTTASGKEMVTALICVDVARPGEGKDTEWVNIAAFAAVAARLAQHKRGDLVAVMGRLCRTRFTDRNGQERTSWGLTAAAIVSARTARPDRRSASQPSRARQQTARPARGAAAPMVADDVSDLWRDGLVP